MPAMPLLTLTSMSRYSDSEYEYRHVQLPKNMLKKIPSDYFDASKGTLKLLWEEEWRGLGITQVPYLCSRGEAQFIKSNSTDDD